MYQFPEDLKKAYESSALAFAYYQNVDGEAVPVLLSDGFCRSVGLEREEALYWLRTGMFERMHPDDVGVVARVSEEFLSRRGPYDVIFRCRIGGEYHIVHGRGVWQTMPDGTELAVIDYSNITQTMEKMSAVMENYDLFRRDSFYSDPLTGLPNINYFHEYAEEKAAVIRADGRTPTVVYSDVCSMQSYNNRYGFKAGDELLCLVAATLKELFPKALLIRDADDHFITLTGVDDREELSRRLDLANARIKTASRGNTAGLHSGICPASEGRDVTDALDYAKRAFKRISRDLSRNCAFFNQAADERYWRERYIIENFDRALQSGWIKVFYQGIFRVESGKLASLEALARWVDPVRGIIPPGEFLPVLQQYQQLYKLDLFMMEQVCREVPIRLERGLPLVPVSVNFSRQDFDHIDVAEELDRLFDRCGMARYTDKSCFIVEITEQDVAVGAESFKAQLHRIREAGYQLWLDDFGSGYSSISMFSQSKLDLIKYDMELLRHLDDNGGANRLILRELVFVAKKLGIHTLIEGLENEEQLQFVRDIGCELVQGYYFHKPEPLDEILFRLRGGMKARPCETKEERESYSAITIG